MSPIISIARNRFLPVGLIVPFNSSGSVPSGWDAWATANGKHIVGAGLSYAVGANATGTTLSRDTNTSGSHVGQIMNDIDVDWGGNWRGGSWAGDHKHTLSMTYTPAYRQLILIKSNTIVIDFPVNAVVFSKTDLSANLSVLLSGDNKLFRAGASLANGAATVSVDSVSAEGSHVHGSANGTDAEQWGDYCSPTVSAGSHNDHACSAVLNTDNVKKAILTAWTDAAKSFRAIAGVIAMYESVTPPAGWFLCDGNNGTLDLRDYFIYIGTTSNHGTRSGNNTVIVNITIGASDWPHGHGTNNQKVPNDDWGDPAMHGSENHVHSHDGTITGSSHTFVPAYYALAFIQKI